jgi:hypothetical protein
VSDIGRVAGGENPSTTGSADDTAVKGEILFTAESYTGPVVKAFINAGYSARRGPIGHKPAVIRIIVGYIKLLVKVPVVNCLSVVVEVSHARGRRAIVNLALLHLSSSSLEQKRARLLGIHHP